VNADEASAVAAAEAIDAAKTTIDQAKLQLEYCTITSPLTGRTGEVTAKAGNLVRMGDAAAMVTVNQIAPIRASFSLPEKHLPTIQKFMAQGSLEVLATPSGENVPCTGTLKFVDNMVDPTTGTINLKAEFENADNRLWPGQFARVTLKMSVQANAVVAPSSAVQMSQKGPFVYVVGADMKAEMRPVKTGDTLNDQTVILEGLKAGEKVVTDGQLLVAPGVEVKPVSETPKAGAPAK
jgi:multidrug efflux system membrane fusion protein